MAKHLSKILSLIDGYLAQHFEAVIKNDKPKPVTALPNPVREAQLQGQAHIRITFFKVMDDMHILDPDSRLFLWDHLFENSKSLIQICERSSLNKYGRFLLPLLVEQSYEERCRHLFGCLVFDMINRRDHDASQHLIEGYVRHFSASLHKPTASKSYEDRRFAMANKLREETGCNYETKEAYWKDGEQHIFELRAHKGSSKKIEKVISKSRAKRLSNARDKAYRLAS